MSKLQLVNTYLIDDADDIDLMLHIVNLFHPYAESYIDFSVSNGDGTYQKYSELTDAAKHYDNTSQKLMFAQSSHRNGCRLVRARHMFEDWTEISIFEGTY